MLDLESDVFRRFVRILKTPGNFDKDLSKVDITLETKLSELMDSMDKYELIHYAEEEFGISIPEEREETN